MTAIDTTKHVTISRDQAATILAALDFNTRTTGTLSQAVRVFQDSWRLGPRLAVDDIIGPQTSAALLLSEARRRAGQATCSEHFSYAEFACKCRCTLPGCRGVWVLGALVDAVEALRAQFYTDGLHVISGYRCPQRNAKIGGKPDSQHQHGAGADVAPRVKWTTLRGRRIASGIGYSRSTGLVVHIDVRHASDSNPTGSTLATPACFPDGP